MFRLPEPELMDDAAQVLAYARADFAASNQAFVDRLVRDTGGRLRLAVDLGCGPGDVVIRLARAVPALHVTAIDGSSAMIALAQQSVTAAALDGRVSPQCVRIPGSGLPDHAFDAVLSKDMLHHLPDPSVLWTEVRRLAAPGAVVCVMDLMRPDTRDAARDIVETVAANEAAVLKEDFFNSLCAAFTMDEVRAQLAAAGLPLAVERIGDRHFVVTGRLG
jgi:ubiquinone/menaquinone biosynthesis C-methylase UbiE